MCPLYSSLKTRKPGMKSVVLSLALLPVLAGLSAIAQPPQQPPAVISQIPPIEDFQPATTNQQGKKFPAVNSERRVRARVVAPQAQGVMLDLAGIKYPLTKGDRKSTRMNSSHLGISYAVFCLKKK